MMSPWPWPTVVMAPALTLAHHRHGTIGDPKAFPAAVGLCTWSNPNFCRDSTGKHYSQKVRDIWLTGEISEEPFFLKKKLTCKCELNVTSKILDASIQLLNVSFLFTQIAVLWQGSQQQNSQQGFDLWTDQHVKAAFGHVPHYWLLHHCEQCLVVNATGHCWTPPNPRHM